VEELAYQPWIWLTTWDSNNHLLLVLKVYELASGKWVKA